MNRKELEQCAWDVTPQDERRDHVEHRVGAKYRGHKRISEPKQRMRKLTGNNREIRVFDPSGSTPGSMSPWMPLWALFNDELMQRCEQGVEPKLRKPYNRTRRDYKSSIENGSASGTVKTSHATKKSPAQHASIGHTRGVRAREIVRLAAEQVKDPSTRYWLLADERGIFEKAARKYLEETADKARTLGMSNEKVNEEIAVMLALSAAEAFLKRARKGR